jgi:hypothetical protein
MLRLWQPEILKVLAKGIDSPLRGFVTASLSGFSVPLIPNTQTGREYTCGGKALKSFRSIASIALTARADAV